MHTQAGVMAKILGKNPNYTPAQLKQYLLATYVQLHDYHNNYEYRISSKNSALLIIRHPLPND